MMRTQQLLRRIAFRPRGSTAYGLIPLLLILCAQQISAANAPAKLPLRPNIGATAAPEATPAAPSSVPTPPPIQIGKPDFSWEISAMYGQGTAISGFSDPRYVAADKSDYLKTKAHTAMLNIEHRIGIDSSFFKDTLPGMDTVLFGIQVPAYAVPYGQSINIPAIKTLGSDPVVANIESEIRAGLGFYLGLLGGDKQIDVGIAILPSITYESTRDRYVFDAQGNYVLDANGQRVIETVSGRGAMFRTTYVRPSFKFVYGNLKNYAFVFSVGRDVMLYSHDYIQTYVRIPLGSYMSFDFGGGLYPVASVFLQPNFQFGGVILGLRAGMSLNYYNNSAKIVAISDSLYFGGNLGYRF